MSNKQWEVQSQLKIQNAKFKIDDLIQILLENRGITSKKEIEAFLHPQMSSVTPDNVGINNKQLEKAMKRIEKAIEEQEQIVIYGDYDVDGITASCILWETLNSLGAEVTPYIPHRIEEGYGLSEKGIINLKSQISNPTLLITVDNGIVANKAVDFANEQGIDVIVTDHHVPEGELIYPNAHAVVHTTQLCGAGVSYLLAQEIISSSSTRLRGSLEISDQVGNNKSFKDDHLAIAALGTIADLVPLTAANRVIVYYGLQELRKTKRPGLLALFKEAAITQSEIGTYEIGRIIAPRLNAMGRLETAMDSLRLLCTPIRKRAEELAEKLGRTNRERQELTKSSIEHARMSLVQSDTVGNLLFLSHESYQQGIIGLIAGRLVEEYYRPAIVIAKGEVHSKASARSVHGFNMVEFIRGAQEHLVDVGGHPMAAGFTVETAKIEVLQQALDELAKTMLLDEHLIRKLRIDCELPFSKINQDLYDRLQVLAPFGMGNPEPTFMSSNVTIEDMRFVGKERQHLKLHVYQPDSEVFEAIGFGMGEVAKDLQIGGTIDIVYTLSENTWNGIKKLQLKIKDISSSPHHP